MSTILERSAKAHAILADIRAILQDVPLGTYKTQVGLQLRESMFVNGVLFNSEVWQGLNTADITMLDTVDHKVMNVICAGHAKTASEFYYLETGTIPLKYLIASRRILYLKNILSRSDEELIKRVYTAQRSTTLLKVILLNLSGRT